MKPSPIKSLFTLNFSLRMRAHLWQRHKLCALCSCLGKMHHPVVLRLPLENSAVSTAVCLVIVSLKGRNIA